MNVDRVMLEANIESIKNRIKKAVLKSGRSMDKIEIIAVAKTIEPERVRRVVELGVTEIGENRVQELCKKYDAFDMKCNWHMIGHLQTNKVKYIIDKVKMIHSLDRVELAEEIQKRAEKTGRVVDVLVQVNVAQEETKRGILKADVLDFIKRINNFSNIKIKGLMTIAPYVEDVERIRWVFRDLRKLLVDMRKENIDNIDMDYLSMGMSNDFEVAVEEGSNMVRIGTAIFGKRNTKEEGENYYGEST